MRRFAAVVCLLLASLLASCAEDATAEVGVDGDVSGVAGSDVDYAGEGLSEVDYALIAAAAEGDEAMVRRVLEAGANVRVATADGETALHTCGISGSAAVARLLLEAGADVDARVTAARGLQMTPLTWFVYGLHLEGAKVLLAHKATLNLVVKDEQGNDLTALDIASRMTEGHEFVALFRKSGGKRFEELDHVERAAYMVGGDIGAYA